MKKIALLILASLLLWGAVRMVFWVTDGFFPWNIRSHLMADSRWDLPPTDPERLKEVEALLKQKFTYFAKGHQAYVFLSEDGKWVLKFPKFQRYRSYPWVSSEKAEKKSEGLAWILDSWKITYEEFPELAGLLFVQINPDTQLSGEVTLVDKLGLEHRLPLSQSTFLIQKRAEVFDHVIKRHYKAKELEPARRALRDLVALYREEYERGIFEKDQHIMRNMGYAEGKMIHIDPARFVKVPKGADKHYFQKELMHKTVRLRAWLKLRYPELLSTLEDEVVK